MEEMEETVTAYQTAAASFLKGTASDEGPPPLAIAVLFTTYNGTYAALRSAAGLSQGLGADIRLVAFEEVPYPLPLSDPPRLPAFWQRRLRLLAAAAGVDANVELFICRDRKQALRRFAQPVVFLLGGRRHWWSGPEQRLTRWLENHGRRVVFIPI